MPIRTDSRQQARLQSTPVIPTLPPEPSLESLYSQEKTNGLTRVFQTYDRARKDWSARVGQHLGRIQDALVKLSATRSGAAVQYPNRGWIRYIQDTAEFGSTVGAFEESSVVYRANSAVIGIIPYWASGYELAAERASAAVSGATAPSDDSVLTGVTVTVLRDSTEDLPIGRGVLRVTLTPTFNTDRGTNPADQIRVNHTYYSLGSDWSQFHYFEPYSGWSYDPDQVYWKDLDIACVYAELV